MVSRLHPLAKLVVCLVWITASIVIFDARFQLATMALVAALLIGVERRSPLLILALCVPFVLFGFGFLTTTVLFRQDSDFALQMAGEAVFASDALSAGIVLFLRVLACGMVSMLFALTTEPGGLVKALMIHWRLPPSIGYSLFWAMHLVPDLAREAQQVRLARAMQRGKPPRRFFGPIEGASLIVPLLAFAIRRASRAALAMETRGLGASAERTFLSAPVAGRADLIFIVAASFVLTALITGVVWF